MSWPSKDPHDYETRGRWEGGGAPRWIAWLGGRSRTPYRFTLAAAVVGLAAGGLVGSLAGWDAWWSAVIGGLSAQVVIDVWWWRRGKRRTSSEEVA